MLYSASTIAVIIFAVLVGIVLGLSFFLGRRAKSAKGYYAAHGQIPWFINGVAFAGDYLSAASFLGICGLIAFYGYDGFLYSIGFLAGWVVALFVIAEPIKRLGKFTFADALDSQFDSRAIKLTAAISTLIVSIFYLIPQMVGAGALITPLLGLKDVHMGGMVIPSFSIGVTGVGIIVILIVTTAGMVSTTWVQFIKGSMLVLFCGFITVLLLGRGFTAKDKNDFPRILSNTEFAEKIASKGKPMDIGAAWGKVSADYYYYRMQMNDGSISTWQVKSQSRNPPDLTWSSTFTECETLSEEKGVKIVNGRPQTKENDLQPVNYVDKLPAEKQGKGPLSFLSTFQNSTIAVVGADKVIDGGVTYSIYYPKLRTGAEILTPGGHPTLFKGIKSKKLMDQLNFISFML